MPGRKRACCRSPAAGRGSPSAVSCSRTRCLSSFSKCANNLGAMDARHREVLIAGLELIPLETDRVLAVIVTEAGWVTARGLNLPPHIAPDDLREIGREITRRVRGRTVQQVLDDYAAPADPLDRLRTRVGALVEQIPDLLRDRTRYVRGAINMLDHPEFLDVAAMRQMLRTFEQKDRLIELLSGLSQLGG